MKTLAYRLAGGLVLALVLTPVALAQQGSKALPTLLIKGDVVSLDRTDPSATLLTVKDRYGFETPIYLSAETAISGGEPPVELDTLRTGATVEVEYNFDVNTAKRHAVAVKVAEPSEPEAAEVTPTPDAAASEAAEATPTEAPPAVEEALSLPPAADAAPAIPEELMTTESAAPEAPPADPEPVMPEGTDAPAP